MIKNLGSTLGACGDVNRNVMGPAAPFNDRPEYDHARQVANDFADLLAPQSGAYYDVWLDGEKFVSGYKEVRRVAAAVLCDCVVRAATAVSCALQLCVCATVLCAARLCFCGRLCGCRGVAVVCVWRGGAAAAAAVALAP